MSYDRHAPELDYYPCTYGGSRIVFRGPQVPLEGAYTVVMGGSETYGRYIEEPFSDRLADLTGRRVVNLGVMNASVDCFARDEEVLKIAMGAETVVLQVTGAANVSNRFFSVHPRRNDRFLRHSILMETLFQDVDFSDFSFVRHMLITLQESSPEKFAIIVQELGEAWVARMRLLLSRIPGRKVLLWIENTAEDELGADPLFVTIDMLQKLEPLIDKVVHCDVAADQGEGMLDDMAYPEFQRGCAERCLSDAGHDRVAHALARSVGRANGMPLGHQARVAQR